MTKPELREFAKCLVENVRDLAIQASDRTLKEDHAIAKRWKAAAETGSPETLASVLIPDIVDTTIFHLLKAIDNGALTLAYTAANGTTVDLTADGLGELSGWYVGSNGWRDWYSKQRFVDDSADLK